jgi:hypothetical protein
MKKRDAFWHALPVDVAKWWRVRSSPGDSLEQSIPMGHVTMANGVINLELPLAKDAAKP